MPLDLDETLTHSELPVTTFGMFCSTSRRRQRPVARSHLASGDLPRRIGGIHLPRMQPGSFLLRDGDLSEARVDEILSPCR